VGRIAAASAGGVRNARTFSLGISRLAAIPWLQVKGKLHDEINKDGVLSFASQNPGAQCVVDMT